MATPPQGGGGRHPHPEGGGGENTTHKGEARSKQHPKEGGREKHNTRKEYNEKHHHPHQEWEKRENNTTHKEDHITFSFLTTFHSNLISLRHYSVQFQKGQRQHNPKEVEGGNTTKKGWKSSKHHTPKKK